MSIEAQEVLLEEKAVHGQSKGPKLKTAQLNRRNKDVVVNEVRTTNDYAKFKLLKGNRDVDPAHVTELVNSMKEQYLEIPIQVNEKFQVIDGQHRLAACQELGLPVFYTMHDGWGMDHVHRLNTHQSNWNSMDYLLAYAKVERPHYVAFLKFMEENRFGFQITHTLLSGSNSVPRGYRTKEFRKGHFEIEDLQRAILVAGKIKEFAQFYVGYNPDSKLSFRDNFCLAIIRIANKNMEYVNEMLDKFKSGGAAPTLYHRALTSDYIKDLEEQYNRGKSSKNHVRWI